MSKRITSTKNTQVFEGLVQKTCIFGDSVADRAQAGHQGSSEDHNHKDTAVFERRTQETP